MEVTPRLTSVVFRLTRAKLDALKALSRATRVRQSEYLREAIADLLAKYQVPLDT
ncbi:MAG: ribbon-helix-helix domain-containing protein [Myxococcaceae bacterium]